ncbi:MAG: glycosyltransferase family 4 protein [Candidatus Didemnitutus sp.]|nr:glycosyltransferase family 4 protein [Candidatus Didemnitutus sp.]
MKTILLSPELFLGEGGIARIMRLYLKSLCELAAPSEPVVAIVLNDFPGHDSKLPRYSTPALQAILGCSRSKWRFARATLSQAQRDARIVCGHLHQLPIAWLAQRLNPGLAYYLVAHGIEVWRPYSALEVRAMRGATAIWCISEYTRRQMLRFCPQLDPRRLVVVPNTFDPFFTPTALPPTVPTPGAPKLLVVSRLATTDTYKGIDTVIEAMPAFLRQHPHAQLRIVGGGNDVPRLTALVAALHLQQAVTLTGIIDDAALRAEYANCDVFALPSRKEGFGLVYLEAMIYGKPCLGARAGGAPEVINDHVGVLADYGNIPEIAVALDDLVRHPRDAATIRAHADSFDFTHFTARLAHALR